MSDGLNDNASPSTINRQTVNRQPKEAMLSQNSLGIDIRSDRVAIAYLKASLGKVRLAIHAVYSLDENLKSDKEKLDAVSDLTTDFITENRLAPADIFIGIPGELTIFRDIEFPLAVKENLRTTLRYEMEKYIPLPVESIYFDYQILSEDKKRNRMKVLLTVAKKTDIEPYADFCISLSRSRVGKRIGVSGIESRTTALANFFLYIKGKRGRTSDREILKLLSEETDIDIYSVKLAKAGIPSHDLIPAFGLALKGVWKAVPLRLNLLPPELQKKPGKAGYYVMIFLTVMILLAGLAWGGSHILKQRLIMDDLDAELTRLRSELVNIDQIRGSFQEIEDRMDYLNALRRNRISVLDVLREFTQAIPETAWIRELRLSEKGIQLNGYAESASDLIPLLEDSLLFKDVVFLSTITKEKDGKERFRIGLKIAD